MNYSPNQIVIVTPVYDDFDAFSQLLQNLSHEFSDKFFLVAIDDGSVKQPLSINTLTDNSINGVVVKLRRNVGHQKAIAIGLSYVFENIANFQQLIVMDCDGEDKVEDINNLLTKLKNDDVDIVVAQRNKRKESSFFKLFYVLFKIIFALFTGKKLNFGNFMAMSRFSVRRLVAMQELSIHLAATAIASKLRTTHYLVNRGVRYTGNSKMNFVSLVLHGFKAMMIFADDVLVRVGIFCAFITALSVAGSLSAVFLKSIGFATPGWFSVALGILFLVLLQTGALALMTLMLTGVIRSGTVANRLEYKNFIEEIIASARCHKSR